MCSLQACVPVRLLYVPAGQGTAVSEQEQQRSVAHTRRDSTWEEGQVAMAEGQAGNARAPVVPPNKLLSQPAYPQHRQRTHGT